MPEVTGITKKSFNGPLPSGRVTEEGKKEQEAMDKKPNLILRNESGVALVVALLMVVILSLIGLASSSTSNYEIRLSGNKRGATDAFYSADAGAASVQADIANFNLSNGYQPVTMSTLVTELQSESIDTSYTSTSFSLPDNVKFVDNPLVTIYHSTKTTVPRGLGVSATSFRFSYYIVDSTGKDQMGTTIFRPNCEIREKLVRIIPTEQGGQ